MACSGGAPSSAGGSVTAAGPVIAARRSARTAADATAVSRGAPAGIVVREIVVGAADASGCNVGLNDLHSLLALLPLLLLLQLLGCLIDL
jgi:hypothetical protein